MLEPIFTEHVLAAIRGQPIGCPMMSSVDVTGVSRAGSQDGAGAPHLATHGGAPTVGCSTSVGCVTRGVATLIKTSTDKVNRQADTAEQDMRAYHQAMTAEIAATRNATADAIIAAGLIQGVIADARSVGTTLAYNQTGSIIKQALAGGNGINTASVAPNGGSTGSGGFTANIKVEADATADPQQTAIAIRDALLIANRRGSIPSIFGGR